MKFLCPQCKAKYRIADEKLAQRASSRMKCRKCGHVIDIQSALVPESIRAPAAGDDDDDDDLESPRQNVPRVAATGAGTSPRRPAGGGGVAAAKRPAVAPKRAVGAPPRRGGAAAAAQAVAEKTAPTIEDAIAATGPMPQRADFEEDAPTRIHDGGALTAAFSLAVGDSPGQAGPPSVQDEWYVGIEGTPTGPLTLAELREKAAAGKATLESLVWRDGFEDWKPLGDFPELVALVAETRQPSSVVIAPEPNTLRAPAALDGGSGNKITVSDLPLDVLEQIGAKERKSGSHPAAWAAVLVAMAFGVTVGIVLFSKTEQKEIVKYVEVPASAKPGDPVVPDDPQTIEEAQVSGNGTKRVASTTGTKTEPTPAAVGSSKSTGLSGLSGLSGLNGLGPNAASPDVAQAAAPGGQLDGASIQRVVGNFTSSVRRGCWDQALASRSPDAPSSARVAVTITISPSGSVDNVTTSGDPKGYPNLAHCIESRVRGWHFPRSSGTTTANVPFVFAAQ